MGFEIRKFPDHIRENILPSDEEIFDKCKECPIKKECGGHREFLLQDDSRFCDRECWKCRAVCCKLDDIYERLDEFDGINFDSVSYNYWDRDWPEFIWVIDESIDNIDDDWYSISFDRVYNEGYDSFNQSDSQKDRYDVKDGTLSLSFNTKDRVIDHFNSAEKIQDLSLKLQEYDFDFLFGVNFSIYKNYPRVDQLLNMKRRVYSLQQFQEQGFNVIPSICFITDRDIIRWAEWFNKERINTCLINFQTKSNELDDKYNKTIEDMEKFNELLDFDCHYFIAGVGIEKIDSFKNTLENITFLNYSAWKNASFRQSIINKEKLKNEDYDKLEIFKTNKKILKSVYNDREPKIDQNKKITFGLK